MDISESRSITLVLDAKEASALKMIANDGLTHVPTDIDEYATVLKFQQALWLKLDDIGVEIL